MRWVRPTEILVGLTFFFATLLFFYDLLDDRFLLTERDLAPYFIPPRFFWIESLKQGDFPLWNPYQFSGHPFFANPQNAALYPLNGLFFCFPFDIAFNAIILLHFFLAGLFTYLFLRDLKVGPTGSLISGLIWMLGGYLLSVHSLLTILLSVAWTPLVMLFFRRAIERPGIKNEILTAIFMTISFLGGGIEIVYGNFFVLLIMMIFPLQQSNPPSLPFPKLTVSHKSGAGYKEHSDRSPIPLLTSPLKGEESPEARDDYPPLQGEGRGGAIQESQLHQSYIPLLCPRGLRGLWDGRIKVLLYRFKSFLVISTIFLVLSAIQLVPFLELWIHSIRGQGISYQEATIWSLAPKDFLLFFLPDVYGYFLDMKKYWVTQCWLKTMYTGGLPFILSLIFFLIPHPVPLPEGEGVRGNPLPEREGARGNPLAGEEGSRRNPLPYGGERRVRGIGRSRMLFLSLMFFSLFLSLGQYNPLYPLVFKYLPFFNGIRYPVKFLYLFILALAITAGLGFERLVQFSNRVRENNDPVSLPRKRESRNVRKSWIPAGVYPALQCGAGMTFQMIKRLFQQPAKKSDGKWLKHLFIFFSLISGLFLLFLIQGHQEIEQFLKLKEIDFPHFNHLSANLYHIKRFFFYLTVFFLILRVGYEVRWKGWIKFLLLFFLAADLFGNMGFYGKEKSHDYFKKTRVLEIITSDKEPLRAFSTGKTVGLDSPILIGNGSPFDLIKEKHLPSLNMIYQVHDIWGLDVVRLKRSNDLYKKFISLPSISSSHLVDLYGVKYVISITPIEEEAGFELLYARLEGLEGNQKDLLKQNTIKLYRNRNHLQRAWLVKDFKVMDSKEMLSTIAQKNFDPRKEVLLEERPPHPDPLPEGEGNRRSPLPIGEGGRVRGSGAVDLVAERKNGLILQVEVHDESILVLSDTYYPGWKVFVNGKKEKILCANYNFRAVVLPKGSNRVEFVYSPISFKLGAVITFIGILGCLAGWVVQRNPRNP